MRSQISKCCKNFKNNVFDPKPKISTSQEHKKHFPENNFAKKLFPLKCNFFPRDMTYPHIDQNGISGKSVKNAPTSRPHNFFKNINKNGASSFKVL